MEGSFWRLGHDLADLYRDRMTLRQLWVRLQVVFADPQSLLNLTLDRDRAEAEESGQITDIDDALANVMRPPNGG